MFLICFQLRNIYRVIFTSVICCSSGHESQVQGQAQDTLFVWTNYLPWLFNLEFVVQGVQRKIVRPDGLCVLLYKNIQFCFSEEHILLQSLILDYVSMKSCT